MLAEVKSVKGFEDAFRCMFISKRTLTKDLSDEIDRVCRLVLNQNTGFMADSVANGDINQEAKDQFNKWLDMLCKMGRKHITVLRFIDISIMTWGMHRAGQDDIDSHAKRFDNRIIRSSTRIKGGKDFLNAEMSAWYQDKIMTTGMAAESLGIELPKSFEKDGEEWVAVTNGYVRKSDVDNRDITRGLLMLSIPSDFQSKINVCEFAHVYKQRNSEGHANPEVKQWAEMVLAGIFDAFPQFNRELMMEIEN